MKIIHVIEEDACIHSKLRVLVLHCYNGACDVKELDNFLFYFEKYLWIIQLDLDE